uniref:Uncharacterized protein n=1 Tax=Trichinella nativa TaxID=6335 RepID=A0A0V1KI13_9BILA
MARGLLFRSEWGCSASQGESTPIQQYNFNLAENSVSNQQGQSTL